MATVNILAARESTIRAALGEALQQVMRGLFHIQELVVQQERRMEERLLEMEQMIQVVSAEHGTRLQEQGTEATGASVEETRRVATSGFEGIIRRLEERVKVLERRSPASEEQETGRVPGGEERLAHLENRMKLLEASTEKALQSVVPRVDALLKDLRIPSPPMVSPSTSTSRVGSASPPFSSASTSSASSHPRSPSTGSAAAPPLMHERGKELGEELIKAAEEGRETDVRRLLDQGADVNFSKVDRFTPLMYAARNAHVNIVSLLIGKGADVNATNRVTYTALHLATLKDKSGRCASLLIRAGALVDSTNLFGQTPLHCASMEDNQAAARALLSAGASTSVRANDWKTPTEYARTNNLRQLLRP